MKLAMKLLLFLIVVLCLVGSASALQIVPDMYGFGTDTRAAYGAANDPEICIVNSLATTSGDPSWNATSYSVGVYEGTFLQCVDLDTTAGGTVDGHTISANSGKVILFEVSGIIGDTTQRTWYLSNNYTSILGQSAPSPGILFKNVTFVIRNNDVFMQHLRFRQTIDTSKNCVSVGTSAGGAGYYNVFNVVVDHCSMSWAHSDSSNFLIHQYIGGATTENITISNSIMSEGINVTGAGPKGMQASQDTEKITISTNLFTGNLMRNPYIRGSKIGIFNNLAYNNGDANCALYGGDNPTGGTDISYVGNVAKGGPWGPTDTYPQKTIVMLHTLGTGSEIYLLDNRCDNTTNGDSAYVQSSASDWTKVDDDRAFQNGPFDGYKVLSAPSDTWPAGFTAIASDTVVDQVTNYSGARPADRDAVDTRLIGEVLNGTGISVRLESVPEWPTLAENTDTLSIPSNPHSDSGNGYTNLEVWLQGLADDVEGDAEEEAPNATDFTYHKIITINQTMVNQSVGTGIYPLLVSTTDTDLRDNAQADGDDIVFFASDNTSLLPYEQEFWNSTNGELVEHVGVTDITNVTHIVMYYNNSTIANSENATGVWDSNFKIVQHLNETPAGTTYDSTSNNNDGTTTGMDSADQVPGQIDGSLDLDGADRIPLTSLAVDNNAAFTISTWMYGEPGGIAYGEGYSGDDAWAMFLGIDPNSPYSARFYYKESGSWKALTTGTTQVNDTWHHVVLSQASKSSRTIYIDGVAEETDTDAVGDMSTLDTTNIGVLERATFGSYFTGMIDELRISDTARSAEWTETEYNNTAYPELFISIGAEQGEGAPDTKYEYWSGLAWTEGALDIYIDIGCFWWTPICDNIEQTDSQPTLKITNNGTAAGTPKMKLNESAPAGIRIFIDDDNTFADAVELTNTYQAVSTSLNQDTNITLWAWANLSGASAWEFETYAIVE